MFFDIDWCSENGARVDGVRQDHAELSTNGCAMQTALTRMHTEHSMITHDVVLKIVVNMSRTAYSNNGFRRPSAQTEGHVVLGAFSVKSTAVLLTRIP